MEEKHSYSAGKMIGAIVLSLILAFTVGIFLFMAEYPFNRYLNYYIVFPLQPEIHRDIMQATPDGAYEYCLQTRNEGWGNIYLQLCVLEIATGEEIIVTLIERNEKFNSYNQRQQFKIVAFGCIIHNSYC